METMKKCKHCGKMLPLDQFYKNCKAKDGHASWCKECAKEYAKQGAAVKVRGRVNLKNAMPVELMTELANRGYYGTLYFKELKKGTIEHNGHTGTFEFMDRHEIDIKRFKATKEE